MGSFGQVARSKHGSMLAEIPIKRRPWIGDRKPIVDLHHPPACRAAALRLGPEKRGDSRSKLRPLARLTCGKIVYERRVGKKDS